MAAKTRCLFVLLIALPYSTVCSVIRSSDGEAKKQVAVEEQLIYLNVTLNVIEDSTTEFTTELAPAETSVLVPENATASDGKCPNLF